MYTACAYRFAYSSQMDTAMQEVSPAERHCAMPEDRKKTSISLTAQMAARVAGSGLSMPALIALGLDCHAGQHSAADLWAAHFRAALDMGERAAAQWQVRLDAMRAQRNAARAECSALQAALEGLESGLGATVRQAVADGIRDAMSTHS